MTWLKLHTDILDDEKIAELSGEVFRDFIMLLSYAAELKNKGIIDKTISQISWRLRLSVDRLEVAITKLSELKIITFENGTIRFLNWEKRQYDQGYLRVKKYRQKRKTDTNETAKETVKKWNDNTCDNANDNKHDNAKETVNTDTDTEKETTLSGKKQARLHVEIVYREIIDDLNSLSGRKFQHHIPSTRALIDARFREGRTLDDFRQVHRNKLAWVKDPENSKYYRPETLYSAKHFESYLNESPPRVVPNPETREAEQAAARERRLQILEQRRMKNVEGAAVNQAAGNDAGVSGEGQDGAVREAGGGNGGQDKTEGIRNENNPVVR